MSVSNDGSEPRYGNMVAVEGNADLVATQLRLLPLSSKILILPALSTALPSVSAEPFEARRWIRHVHYAFTTRSETARSFLQSSTSMQPRLVFINGGSVSARLECICRIAEQLTNGRIDEAEAIFDDIVKDGVTGILRPDPVEEEAPSEDSFHSASNANLQLKKLINPHDYRGAAAMEAADRLDRQTSDLQSTPESAIFEMPKEQRSNLSHLPQPGHEMDQSQESEEEDLSSFSGGHIKRTVIVIPNRIEDQDLLSAESKRGTFGMLPATTYTPEPRSSSIMIRESLYEHDEGDDDGDDELYGDKYEVSHGEIEFGHAQVIRVPEPTSPPRNMRSVKSVDRLAPGTIKSRRRSRSLTPRLMSTRGLAHRTAALKGFGHGRRSSLSDLEKTPETAFVRASSTTIKKSNGKSSAANSPTRIYVDRGTDACSIHSTEEPMPPIANIDRNVRDTIHFEPVFAVVEDLIIHFTDGADNSPLESVIRSYKDGTYPVIPVSKSSSYSLESNSPQSPNGSVPERFRNSSQWTAETDDTGYHRRHESNPYNAGNVPVESKQVWWPQRNGTRIVSPAVSTPAPLSPAATPPPTQASVANRFHRFSPINSKTATGIQNSLRAVLNIHFPPELTNYRQYSVPVEVDRLWKPVFRDSDGHSQEGRTVDQIIAIGAEDGVNSNFVNEIAGQVERLGTKKNGTTRSGKLDMRFLIASAMQTFTKQSLSAQSQSSSSPFSSPMLLASLLVPQLETYLASNASIRLLIIHYSSSHLPTILALRHLVGADTLKVAGILDTNESLPFTRPTGNRLSNANVAAYNSRTRSNTVTSARSTTHSPAQSIEFKQNISEPIRTSFLRANYILESIATDVEKANFLSKITSHLIEKSSYYTPEPTLHSPRKISGSLHSPLSTSFPPNSTNNTSTTWKSINTPLTPTSNSSRPMTPQTLSSESSRIVGQSLNSNITRPQSNLNNYATSNKPSTFTNYSIPCNNNNPNRRGSLSPANSPTSTNSFIPPSSKHFSPSLTSTSSTISCHNRTYSPTALSHSTSNRSVSNSNNTSTTIFNSSTLASNTTLQRQNSQRQPSLRHQIHNHSNTNSSNNILGFTNLGDSGSRPTTADARERQSERDWANFYLGDSDEEDEFDRILMPRIPRNRMERKKGNSRKALKWLGLA